VSWQKVVGLRGSSAAEKGGEGLSKEVCTGKFPRNRSWSWHCPSAEEEVSR